MRRKIWLLIIPWLISLPTYAQLQRALLIGIDHYSPPAGYTPENANGRSGYINLGGCRNDALAIYSIITSKFGFDQKNIDTLYNESATREGILNATQRLLSESNAGDIAFIYYAGHGSEVRNSLSFEVDKKDQTIVPSDAWKEGVMDIRDKELSKLFNEFIDKGIKLTVIFDCCHSGSISRGPNATPGKLRYLPMADRDAKDPARYAIPELRKGDDFLIFSAAQSNEFAAEQVDDQGIQHGAFTLALTEALNQQSVDASALEIFTSARAILKSNGKNQEPVIGGTRERQQETLFGIKKGKLSDYSYVAVSGIINKRVQLQAGFALGLAKENELAMFNDHQDTVFKLRIDTVLGVTKSLASMIKGNIRDIKPGYQFRVTNWVSSGRPLIKLFIPRSDLPDADVLKFLNIAKELKHSSKIKWVPSIGKGERDPYTSVFWINDQCFVKVDNTPAIRITNVTAQNILQHCKKDSTLYVELPISKQNANEYYNKLIQNRSLQLVESINSSNYTLFGRLGIHGFPAYGFRKTGIATGDSLESMPIETDCFEAEPARTGTPAVNVGDSLFELAMKLSKLKGWLSITGPDATRKGFPYHLELFNDDTRQIIVSGMYHIGELVSIKLVANDNYASWRGEPKYVYVFAIDQSGAMELYFPGDDGNVTNKYPKFDNGNLVKEVTLLSATIPPPSGTDNYFLLACDEPIQNATQIFNQAGVYAGVSSRGIIDTSNPLTELLDIGNVGSRGLPKKLPATWSLEKYSFRCTYSTNASATK